MAVKRFTDEEINKANNISIVDYINKLNLEIKKTGKTLKIEGHGGLHINPERNVWNCFKEKKNGGPIQLVMHLENKTWVEAIKTLLGSSYESSNINNRVYNKSRENKELNLPNKNNTYNHVIAYLIQSRGIDKDIVYQMISSKKIYEDKRKNCVFVGYDKNNNPKYAGLRGTNTSIPFKGEVQGSNKGYSFNITNTEDKTLYVFESPIELMSYMTLYKKYCGEDFNFNGLSLAGTSDIALERFLKDNDISTINLCLDNDEAGKKAIVEIREKYKDDYLIQIKLPKLKDWNEDLVYSSDTLTDTLKKTDNISEKIDEWAMEL